MTKKTARLRPCYAVVLAAVMATGLLTGCATPASRRLQSLDIHASIPSRLKIHDTHVPIESLGRKLRSVGASRHTRITLHVPRHADPRTASLVMERLVSLGYPKVIVARERAPQVTVDPENRSARKRR